MAMGSMRRKSPRLPGYNYRRPGAYFVTIATKNRVCLFGDVEEEEVRLSVEGTIAEKCWRAIPGHHKHVELDAFVIMPNHVHGIICLMDDITDQRSESDATNRLVGETRSRDTIYRVPTQAATPRKFGGSEAGSLSTIVATYKAAVTRDNNKRNGTPGQSIWQARFYDHIIRLQNPDELDRIREYIGANPVRWHLDRENPSNTRRDSG